jgi:arylsulfatase A
MIKRFLLAGLATCLLCGPLPAQQPNIVLVLADDLGYEDIGCYGNTFHETPHIDSLAARGLKLTRNYSSGAVCSPTRASLLTGNFPARLHVTEVYDWGYTTEANTPLLCDTDVPMDPNWLYLATSLKSLGYATGVFGKWHLLGVTPQQAGFDTVSLPAPAAWGSATEGQYGDNVFNNDEWRTEQITTETMAFMESAVTADQPFFAFVSHNLPHVPWGTTTALFNKYQQKLAGGAEDWQGATYAGMVEQLDDSVGALLTKLDDLGELDNTLFIFTSDNGPVGTADTFLNSRKARPLDGGIRVPFLATWPGSITPGTVRDDVVVTADFFPTFHEIAGGDPADLAGKVIDGRSFLPVLLGQTQAKRAPIVFHFPMGRDNVVGGWSALLDWPHKYIHYWEGSLVPDWPRAEELENRLHDLDDDPRELTNLIESNSPLADDMRARLMNWLAANDAQIPTMPTTAEPTSGSLVLYTTDQPGSAAAAKLWALTRPANGAAEQGIHYNPDGGNNISPGGAVLVPSPTFDTSAPSTLSIVLDTTAGDGDWSADYHQGSELLGSVTGLGAVSIGGVGLGISHADDVAVDYHFQSFELRLISADVAAWSEGYGEPSVTDFAADFDRDGLNNGEEYLWGLDPTDPSSVTPVSVPPDGSRGTFSYTRRDPSLSGASYSYQWSDSLDTWHPLTPAAELPDADSPVETVTVLLDSALRAKTKVFVRVVAEN